MIFFNINCKLLRILIQGKTVLLRKFILLDSITLYCFIYYMRMVKLSFIASLLLTNRSYNIDRELS